MVKARLSVYFILTNRTDLLSVSRGCAVKYAPKSMNKERLQNQSDLDPDIITQLSRIIKIIQPIAFYGSYKFSRQKRL